MAQERDSQSRALATLDGTDASVLEQRWVQDLVAVENDPGGSIASTGNKPPQIDRVAQISTPFLFPFSNNVSNGAIFKILLLPENLSPRIAILYLLLLQLRNS